MSKSQRVQVSLPKSQSSYEIIIGTGTLAHVGDEARRVTENSRRACLISNPKVFSLYGRAVVKGLRQSGFQVSHWLMPDGEQHKNLRVLQHALRFLADEHLERSDLVVALGGGVVGDLAGLAAALYLRGIKVIQIPTTLLAQIDASVGGKTAVNTPFGKNLIGAFHQPSAVIIDTHTLQTLPRRELTAGWCEAIKQGAVASPRLFWKTRRYLEANERRAASDSSMELLELIAAQCAFKAGIVTADEREDLANLSGTSRRILNFGHTIAHALEAVTNFRRFRHGEAVGIGMIAAAEISTRMGKLAETDLAQLRETIRLAGHLPRSDDLDHREILRAVARDKKSYGGQVHWVLLGRIGRPLLVEGQMIPVKILRDSVHAALANR